jgi:hypothetical protein
VQVLMCLLNIPFITPKHDDFLLKGRSSLNVVLVKGLYIFIVNLVIYLLGLNLWLFIWQLILIKIKWSSQSQSHFQLLQLICTTFKLDLPFRRKSSCFGVMKGMFNKHIKTCTNEGFYWDWEDHFIFISINCHINSQRFKPNKYITKFTIKIYKPFTIHTSYSEVWNNLNKYILGPRMSVLCANAYNLLPNTVIVIFHQFSFKMLVLSTLMVSLRYGLNTIIFFRIPKEEKFKLHWVCF